MLSCSARAKYGPHLPGEQVEREPERPQQQGDEQQRAAEPGAEPARTAVQIEPAPGKRSKAGKCIQAIIAPAGVLSSTETLSRSGLATTLSTDSRRDERCVEQRSGRYDPWGAEDALGRVPIQQKHHQKPEGSYSI